MLEVRRDLPELVSELLEAAVSGRACTYMSPWEGGGRATGEERTASRRRAYECRRAITQLFTQSCNYPKLRLLGPRLRPSGAPHNLGSGPNLWRVVLLAVIG